MYREFWSEPIVRILVFLSLSLEFSFRPKRKYTNQSVKVQFAEAMESQGKPISSLDPCPLCQDGIDTYDIVGISVST